MKAELGFGAASLGNLFTAIDDDAAMAAVEAAWSAGIRHFDTAPHYGLGLSERRLGSALVGRPREEYVLSSKVGRLLEANPGGGNGRDSQGFDVPDDVVRRWDFSESGIRRSIEESLTRLGLDRLDIAYLHDPEEGDLEAGIRNALPALERLRAEGMVDRIGVGSKSVEALLSCVEATDLDLIMLAGRYTLLEQPAAEDLLPACLRRGTSVVNVGIFNSGVLARPEVPDEPRYEYGAAPARVIDQARTLARICDGFGVDLPTAALHFAARHEAVQTVIVGAGKPAHVTDAARRATLDVPEELWTELERRELVAG